ncbi:MAG: anion permease [Thaumarchaeota archaeon]|nr:anion permease [Nitrososphaerota archaeon]
MVRTAPPYRLTLGGVGVLVLVGAYLTQILAWNQILALTIFVVTYFLITVAVEEERAIVTMFGAFLMWFLQIVPSDKIAGYIDLRAIMLLFGMMLIAGFLKRAGFFSWLGYYLMKVSRGSSRLLLIYLSLSTALLSALVNEITVIVFMVLVTIDICRKMEISPRPYIISEIMIANVGGSATAIGSPPNIMILTAAEFRVVDFLVNMGPVVALALPVLMAIVLFWYRNELPKEKISIPISANKIEDRRLFTLSVGAFIVTAALLIVHDLFHISPAVIAVVMGIVVLFLAGRGQRMVLNEVDWPTLLFFASLFVLVGGLNEAGLLNMLSSGIQNIAGSNGVLASILILWTVSLTSAVVDNIPMVAAFIPVIKEYSVSAGVPANILWWSMALGAAFGANGTAIGSSANIISLSLAEKNGYRVTFMEFLKIGMLVLFATLALSQLVIFVRFARGLW